MNRAYTVEELDALRRACSNRWLYGTSDLPSGNFMSRSYKEDERVRSVEELVRTHMIAGHVAQDLIDADRKSVGG